MNEVVKRRAAGALLLIGLAFIAVSLLPGVGESPGEEGVKVVVIDLGAPEPATPDALPMETPPPGVAAAPPVTVTDEGAQGTDSLPDPGEATAEPEPEPAAEPAGASPSPETKGTHPALKFAETITPAPASTPKPSEPLPTANVAKAAPETDKPSSPAPTPRASAPASTTTPTPVKPATLPSPAPVPSTVAKPDSSAPVPVASARAAWYVQVGGFAEVQNAHQAQDRLKAAGEASIIAPMDSAKGTLYRVRAGPYASREAATAAQQKIAAGGFPGATVINP